METATHNSTNLGVTRVQIASVAIQDKTERLTWIHNDDYSVSLVISEQVFGTKYGQPRVIGEFTAVEGKDEIKAVCRDYVRRQNNRHIDPLPMRQMRAEDLRDPDLQIVFDKTGRGYFGRPR